MKNNSANYTILFFIPLLCLILSLGGCSGGIINIPGEEEVSASDLLIDTAQDTTSIGIIEFTPPADGTITEVEVRVIESFDYISEGSWDNATVAQTITGLTAGTKMTQTITGLKRNTTYKVALFDNSSKFKVSNTIEISTAFRTVYSKPFAYSVAHIPAKDDLNGDGYTDFVYGGSSDTVGSNDDKVAILYGTGSAQSDNFDIVTITGTANDFNLGSCLLIEDLNSDGHNDLVVCDSEYTKPQVVGPDLQDSGICYIFYGDGTKLTSTTVAAADETLEEALAAANMRFGSSCAYDRVNEFLLIGEPGFSRAEAPCNGGEYCGDIHVWKWNADTQSMEDFNRIRENDGIQTARVGNDMTVGDYYGNGSTVLFYTYRRDRLGNNTLCRQMDMADTINSAGKTLHEGTLCPSDDQGSVNANPSIGNYFDGNSDGYDDFMFIELTHDINASPIYTWQLSYYYGGPVFDIANSVTIDSTTLGDDSIGVTVDKGDMNGDGVDDIVLMSEEVAYVYPDGDLTGTPISYVVPQGLAGIVEDTNGDGYADVIRGNSNAWEIGKISISY